MFGFRKTPPPAPPKGADGDIKLICGLGNPGPEYADTRHNCGFRAVDLLAERKGASYWKSESGALTCHVLIGGKQVLLAKPMSFMNTSGGPLSKLMAAHGVAADEVVVIHDELDIPVGDVRVKIGGGHAGHNGLRSIIEKIQTKEFARIRVGIGRPPGRMKVADFVLTVARSEQAELIDRAVVIAADAAEDTVVYGLVHARDTFNAPK